jgi:hypothetical protein
MNEEWETGQHDLGLSRELRDTLVRHAEEGTGRPTDLESVQGRALRIRRNRRAVVAGGLVAVAAIAAPLAVMGVDALRADAPQVTIAPHSELRVPYARGTTLVLPDGSVRELPQKFQEGGVIGQDFFGAAGDEDTGGNSLTRVDSSGQPTEREPIGSSLAWSRDTSVLAYADEAGTHQLLRDRYGEVNLEAPVYFMPRGVFGGPDCASQGDCAVYGNTPDGPAFYGRDLGFEAPSSAQRLNDMTEDGLMAVETRQTATRTCGGIYDAAAGTMSFQGCDWVPTRFSADGSYVLAQTQAYDDLGMLPPSVGILDSSTGEALAQYVPQKNEVMANWMWEDASHVLIQLHRADGWYVLRMGVGGTITTALGPFDNGSDTIPGYTLLGQTM